MLLSVINVTNELFKMALSKKIRSGKRFKYSFFLMQDSLNKFEQKQYFPRLKFIFGRNGDSSYRNESGGNKESAL